MECIVCRRRLSSLDEDGICPRCSEDTDDSDSVDSRRLRRRLTQREFELLLAKLADDSRAGSRKVES
jgi:predicted amidophosphoribosyltransferase